MTIRPHDPLIKTVTRAYSAYSSAEACRRLLDLVFRDCATALDLTYGAGGFWQRSLPPGLTLTTNDLKVTSRADLHLDFRATGLPDDAFDVLIYDPPHTADGGKNSIMARRYGTVKTTAGLRALIEAGMREALRVARVGVLVKLTNACHGSRWLPQSDWVTAVATQQGAHVYCAAHTYRKTNVKYGKWRAHRVPRSNGAIYLCFRLDGPEHRDWEAKFARQEAVREKGRGTCGSTGRGEKTSTRTRRSASGGAGDSTSGPGDAGMAAGTS